MKRVVALPGRYVQGEGVLAELGGYVRNLGRRALVLCGRRARTAVSGQLPSSLRAAGVEFEEAIFGGECTRDEARRVAQLATEANAEVVIGVGGGKTCDTAKAVAALTSRRLVLVPTLASSDAPTSACTVWYTTTGTNAGFNIWKTGPDVILVDTAVIARAPVRYLVAGMGDALATWPEADAAGRSGATSFAGGIPTRAAFTLAKLCYETVLGQGLNAVEAVRNATVTPALDEVVEANILLSGIGWESGGLACAHAVANAISFFPETASCLHGEKVAFGLLVQFCLDPQVPEPELSAVLDFMARVGLPLTLEDLGINVADQERLARFAAKVATKGSTVHNHPFPVTPESISKAMSSADSLGRKWKQSRGC